MHCINSCTLNQEHPSVWNGGKNPWCKDSLWCNSKRTCQVQTAQSTLHCEKVQRVLFKICIESEFNIDVFCSKADTWPSMFESRGLDRSFWLAVLLIAHSLDDVTVTERRVLPRCLQLLTMTLQIVTKGEKVLPPTDYSSCFQFQHEIWSEWCLHK